jgi:hypothetical protein
MFTPASGEAAFTSATHMHRWLEKNTALLGAGTHAAVKSPHTCTVVVKCAYVRQCITCDKHVAWLYTPKPPPHSVTAAAM